MPGSQALYIGIGLLFGAGLLLIVFLGSAGRSPGWWLRSCGLLLATAVLAVYAIGRGGLQTRTAITPAAASAALQPAPDEPPSFVVLADGDGHFRLTGSVNGAKVHFLVDTGASLVILNEADARRVGIDPDKLSYTATFKTANGQTDGALIDIGELAVGAIRLEGVEGAVERQNMGDSLLGASFLRRLGSVKVDGNAMKLSQ